MRILHLPLKTFSNVDLDGFWINCFTSSRIRSTYIPLPTCIQNKKAVINIKNKDEKCFLWAVIAGLYGGPHAGHHDLFTE